MPAKAELHVLFFIMNSSQPRPRGGARTEALRAARSPGPSWEPPTPGDVAEHEFLPGRRIGCRDASIRDLARALARSAPAAQPCVRRYCRFETFKQLIDRRLDRGQTP